MDRLREQIERERPEIEALGRLLLAGIRSTRQVISELKAERQRQGLSLTDIENRTGITRGAISVLENSEAPNPTIKTLQRYAAALGGKLDMRVQVPS